MAEAKDMTVEAKVNRTRMNFGMTAKGFVQMDVTVEYETPEATAAAAREAIAQYKAICAENGLKLADAAA